MKNKPLNEMGMDAREANKEARIRLAAELSNEIPPLKICLRMNISQRTLKRYEKDPRWKVYGGADLPKNFAVTGRPPRDAETDMQLFQEANRLHEAGEKWKYIAYQLGLTTRQLEHIRKKYA